MSEIAYKRYRKTNNKQTYHWSSLIRRKVHRQDARIVHQLITEIKHARYDCGHESLRRAAYAENVLEAVGRELDSDDNEAGPIRAAPLKALSPILARQVRGVPDAYGPAIRAAIAPTKDLPTIKDVTDFYLGRDPLDPRYIRVYRRNIIYSREALWHLAILKRTISVESREDYADFLEVHDLIMENLRDEKPYKGPGIPPFSDFEVGVIVRLHLEGFFKRELSRVVCAISTVSP